MKIDVAVICKNRGITSEEMAALLGVCRTAFARVQDSEKHRQITTGFYLLVHHLTSAAIPVLLQRWVMWDKPKNEAQARVLLAVARRFLGRVPLKKYERLMRKLNPEFFF